MNKTLPADQRAERSPLAPLFGPSGRLDSLRTANYLIAAEELLSADLGADVSLTDLLLGEEEFALPETIRGLARLVAKQIPRQAA
jgi:hypothetical protein